MTDYQAAIEAAKALLAEAEAYEKKPTKASSKRLRKNLQTIKGLVTPAKAELLAADYAKS